MISSFDSKTAFLFSNHFFLRFKRTVDGIFKKPESLNSLQFPSQDLSNCSVPPTSVVWQILYKQRSSGLWSTGYNFYYCHICVRACNTSL